MSFYPSNYEVKDTPSDYMRLPEGEHRIRIMRKPIMGFEFWHEDSEGRHPVRVKTFKEAVADKRASEGIREFHAFIVWDYEESMIRLLNVTQKKIQKAIYELANDEDWGDPTKYDILIKRTGKGFNDTEYTVIAKPAKPVPEEATKALSGITIDEEQYFSGGHPIVRESSDPEDIITSVDEINDSIPF